MDSIELKELIDNIKDGIKDLPDDQREAFESFANALTVSTDQLEQVLVDNVLIELKEYEQLGGLVH